MKPVRGGRPPSDRSIRAEVAVMIGALDQERASVLIFVVIIVLNVRKAADVMMIYVDRVRAVSCGEYCKITIIQPRCAIEE